MPGIILKGRGSIAPQQSRPTEGPEPGFFDTVAAGFRTTEDEVSSVQEKRRFDAYIELEDSLFDMGYSYKDTRHPDIGLFGLIGGGNAGANSTPDTDRIWAIVERERAKNPAAFAGVAKTREEFDEQTLRRNGGRDTDQQTLARGGMVGGFVGAVGGSMTDPFNVLTLPLGGGGKGVISAALREGITNAGLELIQAPTVAQNRKKMGEDTTLGEVATNVAAAFAFGAGIGGTARYGADNWDKIKSLPKDAQEAVWGRIAPLLPEKMRGTMEWDAIPDDLLPDLTEQLIGRENLTPDERTAIEAMRRDIEVRAINPFDDDPAGQATHIDALGDTMARILADPGSGAPVPSAVAAPARASRLTPSALGGSTALRTGTVDTGGRATLKRRIGIVESGGSNSAANPNSTALGKYQFIKGTWTRLYKARYGSGGLTDAQIAGKRADPRLQEILMDDLVDYNARVLERAGSNGSAGDLYVAHFAGAETAARLLRADRNAPASSIFSDAAIKANGSILRGKTVGEVIAWAHRKMGSDPGPMPRGRDVTADPADPIAALNDEIADIDRQLAELDADGGDITSALDDAPLVNPDDLNPAPLDYSSEIPLPKTPLEPEGPPRGQVDEAVERILPELKRISLNTRQSLNRLDVLARQLDSTEEDVGRALQKLALYGGGGIVVTPGGKFRRMPVRSKPLSILEFVAAGGGLRDVRDPGLGGGESLATVFQQLVKRNTKDGTVTQTQPALVPGFGPLLRDGGRTLDEWGEALHEAGYLGRNDDDRPTVSEVLEALKEEFAGRKVYSRYDMGDVIEAEAQASQRGEFGPGNDPLFDDDYSRATWARDLNFNDDELAAIYELWDAARLDDTIVRDLDELVNDAIDAFIDEQIYAARFDAMMEADPEAARYFDALDEAGYGNAAAADREFAPDSAEPRIDGRDAGEGEPGAADGGSARGAGPAAADRSGPLNPDEQGPLDPDSFAAWDDPNTSPGVQGQADSLEHDLRMAVDPAPASAPTPEPTAPALFQPVALPARTMPERPGQDVPMEQYSPVIWREVSVMRARDAIPGETDNLGGLTGYEMFMADNPDLALGQGANQGVLMEFDSGGLTGKINRAKPGWEVGFIEGWGSEYVVSGRGAKPLQNALRAIRVAKQAIARREFRVDLAPALRRLERAGWVKIESDDFVQYVRPDLARAAEVAEVETPEQIVTRLGMDSTELRDMLYDMGQQAEREYAAGNADAFDAYNKLMQARNNMLDAEWDAGEAGRGVARAAAQQAQSAAIMEFMAKGGRLQSATALRINILTQPDHVRLTPAGMVQIRDGSKWANLTPDQLERLAAQAGWKPDAAPEASAADPADMFGGATRDEARQALERRGEGGMTSAAPQKPVGSDGGLFDTGARDQTEFRLDVDGPTMKGEDMLKAIDDEQAAIDAMNACLNPRGGDAA
jgi:hypothetical protein